MDPAMRARAIGLVASVVGVGLMLYGEWGPGLGVLSVGVAATLLVTDRDVPQDLPDRAARGTVAGLARLSSGLGLKGHGVLLPGATPHAPSRLFVPAREVDVGEIPILDADRVLHRDGGSALGVALPPPGEGLEAAWRDRHGLPAGQGAEEAAQHLRAAFPTLGLGRDVTIARSDAGVRVAFIATAHRDTCRATREDLAPWHVQGGCPACSFAAVLVARAFAAPVTVRDAGTDGRRTFLDLEVHAPSSRT